MRCAGWCGIVCAVYETACEHSMPDEPLNPPPLKEPNESLLSILQWLADVDAQLVEITSLSNGQTTFRATARVSANWDNWKGFYGSSGELNEGKSMIKPTVGRVVWLWKNGTPEEGSTEQPHAAIIVYVHSDRCVNLWVLPQHEGEAKLYTSVALRQPEDGPMTYQHAQWMPFQQGQAARTEQLEKRLEKELAIHERGNPFAGGEQEKNG